MVAVYQIVFSPAISTLFFRHWYVEPGEILDIKVALLPRQKLVEPKALAAAFGTLLKKTVVGEEIEEQPLESITR